jgi:hypothetical protein
MEPSRTGTLLRALRWLLVTLLHLALTASAHTQPGAGLWAGASLTTRLLASGVQVSLGARDALGAGVDVRFDLAYLPAVVTMPPPGAAPAPPLLLELSASALGYTSRPESAPSFSLAAYGGAGPRLLALFDAPAAAIGAGACGGVELRYAQTGVSVEGEASLALLGVGSKGVAFGLVPVPIPKLTIGLLYNF